MQRQLFVALLAFHLSNSAIAPAQTKWQNVSAFQFDWDGHRDVNVLLEKPSEWNDPGDFTRIRIRVPGQKEFVLTNQNGWVRYASESASMMPDLMKKRSLTPSKYLLAVGAAHDARTLLFLFGYSYASSPGSLDVLEISQFGQPHVVLHREEFGLAEVRDLDGDGVAEVVGFPCLSQEFGDGLLTYDPLNVYKLDATKGVQARLSIPLSKTYNLAHYYGWAGPKCSESFAVVLHPPRGGKPIVVSTEEAERIVSPKRR
jgi:hypothetical protein